MVHDVARRKAQGPLDVRFEMRFDQGTVDRIQAQAERLGLSMGAYIRSAVIRQLEADEGDARSSSPSAEEGGAS